VNSSVAALEGAVALVTGASDGIGWATALALAEGGATVIAAARRKPRLLELEHEAAATGHIIHGLPTDLTDRKQSLEVIPEVLARCGRLDILVNNAGVMLLADPMSATESDWGTMVELNLVAAMRLTHAALPILEHTARTSSRGVADVVNVGSLSAHNPSAMRAVYAATKAGLAAYSEGLRRELAGRGVRVSLVEPGVTDTKLRSANSDELIQRMTSLTPGIAGVPPLAPERVAAVVRFVVTQPPDTAVTDITVRSSAQRD
jgi:NADP-dependent 3-hydroxy acid dehydrogenase YdfG